MTLRQSNNPASRKWRAKPQACSSLSLTSRAMFTKNLSWQAKQSVPHTAVTFYGDCVNMCEDFAPIFVNRRSSCCITTTHCLKLPFSTEFSTRNNMTVIPHPPYSPDLASCDFSLFPWLKIKLKGRHFDSVEVIEAKWRQCWKHDFQDAFKHWQEHKQCIRTEWDLQTKP
jgi:hypothetical protein